MNKRSLITLTVAVVIGLGAMKVSQVMISSGKGKSEGDTQEVLVAARDFKQDELLKPEMVKVIRMARSAVPPNSFTSFKDVEERWVKSNMMEDDVLVEKKLGPKGTPPGLVANIPAGMRAVATDVTEQSGVSGFILPGHHVDVVRFEPSAKNEFRGETILQDVLVLAAGQLFARPEERSVQSRTVTLALAPGDVDILVAARARGALSLSLRGVNDHNVVARPAPKPAIDAELEKRLKLENEKRIDLERELRDLKQQLARKAAEPAAPTPRPLKGMATIYRGMHNIERVRTDQTGVSELEPVERLALPGAVTNRAQSGFRPTEDVAAGDALEH
ncbi:MAG: Flp pilus assembly protein CpaB [Isosphaerales bacterium]